MQLQSLGNLLGWITALFFGIALLNFFVKYINKNYISKLCKDKKQLVTTYRNIMKIVVKYHKIFGTIAIVAVAFHFIIISSTHSLRLTGVISALLMLVIFLLGFYGTYINKNMKGSWLKIHRILAFVLLLSIAIHVL